MAKRRRKTVATVHATPVPVAPVAGSERVASIDALRAIAILAMVAYHFAFDLRFFGVIGADFENGRFWLVALTEENFDAELR